MKNMENFNFNMANQMLNILKSLNENIVSLSGRGLGIAEGSIMDITQSHLDRCWDKEKEHLEEEL